MFEEFGIWSTSFDDIGVQHPYLEWASSRLASVMTRNGHDTCHDLVASCLCHDLLGVHSYGESSILHGNFFLKFLGFVDGLH